MVIKSQEVEVMDIMTALFDEEEVTRRYGLRMQREKTEDIARIMLAKGKMSVEEIAEYTGLSVSEIEKLSNLQFA